MDVGGLPRTKPDQTDPPDWARSHRNHRISDFGIWVSVIPWAVALGPCPFSVHQRRPQKRTVQVWLEQK